MESCGKSSLRFEKLPKFCCMQGIRIKAMVLCDLAEIIHVLEVESMRRSINFSADGVCSLQIPKDSQTRCAIQSLTQC